MSRDPLQIEVDEINDMYHRALSLMGTQVAKEVKDFLSSDEEVDPQSLSALARITTITEDGRRRAVQLSLLRAALIRGLNTGKTIAIPGIGRNPTINQLRNELATLVMSTGLRSPRAHVKNADALLQTEDILQEIPSHIEGKALAKVKEHARQLLLLRQKYLDGKLPRQLYLEMRRKELSGIQGIVDKSTMDAARGVTRSMMKRDRRIEAWARVAGHYDPCAFCMMLMSRGPVYRSKNTALWAGGVVGDSYHPNCKCEAVLMYRRSEYDNSTNTALNRQLEAFWDENISGKYSGNDALNYLRRWRYHNRKSNLKTALAAA